MIEPSFGVGRIIYCMLEHSFYTRPGSDDRHVFRRAPPSLILIFNLLPIPARCYRVQTFCSPHMRSVPPEPGKAASHKPPRAIRVCKLLGMPLRSDVRAYGSRASSQQLKSLLHVRPRFRAAVAPVKAAVFPLVQKPAMDAHARTISAALTRAGLANSIDTTGARAGFKDCIHSAHHLALK